MLGTIESTHRKILDKVGIIRDNLRVIQNIANQYRMEAENKKGKKYQEAVSLIDNLYIGLTWDNLETTESNYNLAVAVTLTEYYSNPRNEEQHTQEYYRIITSENFVAQIDDAIIKCNAFIEMIQKVDSMHIFSREDSRQFEAVLNNVCKNIEYAQSIEINLKLEKSNYEVCKCGVRMTVMPEYSELWCSQESGGCGKIKKILGVVFRDDQFYPQEGQKTKHGGYDTGRHYRFWMERIQALESKVFPDEDNAKIDYIIERDKIDRRTLDIGKMREILKEAKLTAWNDHAALLVVLHGGPAPPRLDFQENRKMCNRFHKAMTLYDTVVPDGKNKPYYPYFIYKIVEYEFRNNPEKLRLLDYIHLQSRDTVVKNDKIFEKMCELADPERDGLKYFPTDPAGRF